MNKAPRPTKVSLPDTGYIFTCCGMEKMGQCVSDKIQEEMIGWVLCDRCQSWYHAACTGMRTSENEFICCQSSSNNQKLVLDTIGRSIIMSKLE